MHVRLVHVQLPEAGYLVANSLLTCPACEKTKPTLELDLLLERNLRAGEQAHCYVWFSHGGKTARDRVGELRRYEFVSDLCGSGGYMVQTVVAHRRKLPAWDSRDGCPSRRSVSNASATVVLILSSANDKKSCETSCPAVGGASCPARREEDIPAPPLKNQNN